jgi:hypothetical protein
MPRNQVVQVFVILGSGSPFLQLLGVSKALDFAARGALDMPDRRQWLKCGSAASIPYSLVHVWPGPSSIGVPPYRP